MSNENQSVRMKRSGSIRHTVTTPTNSLLVHLLDAGDMKSSEGPPETEDTAGTVSKKLYSYGNVLSLTVKTIHGQKALHVVFDTRETALLAMKCLDGHDHVSSIDFVKMENRPVRQHNGEDAIPERESTFIDQLNDQLEDQFHLQVPQLDSLHLLSPPPSPPVGWEHVVEPIPTVDQALISAMAGLCANENNVIFKAHDDLPEITVLACEDIQPDACMRNRALTHRQDLASRLTLGGGMLGVAGNVPKTLTPRPPRRIADAGTATKASKNMLSV
eukprot:CFRG3508T1